MQLDENYSLEMDTYNFTLKYKNVYFDDKKNKEVTSIDEWHFPNLNGALNKYMNECFKPLQEVKDLFNELKRVENLINQFNK